MEFYEVIEARRSIRRYKADPVSEEQLGQVLNAARLAPSWKNFQCWRFIVIRSEEGRSSVQAAFDETNPGKKAIMAAPVLIVLCADPEASGKMEDRFYYMVDAGITMEHLMLAARAEGLGTCWLGEFKENVVRDVLGVPDGWRVIGMTPLGVPDQDPKPRPRKALEEITFREKWGGSW